MDQGFIDILQKLVSEQGKEALLNPAKCKALLADYTKGEYKKESRLLLQALDAGAQKEIITTAELELCKRQQIRVLQEEHFLSAEAAADIVETLALVLRGEQVPQGAFCANCGKELQQEWASCPYCSTPVVKIRQGPPQPEVPYEQAPYEQTPSATLTVQPPLNKKKNTKRNLIIVGAVLLVILIIVAIVNGITLAPATASSSSSLQSAQAYFDKGKSYYDNNDFDNAITQFNEAIRLEPNNAEAYFKRGSAYWRKDQIDIAIRDFDNALGLDPNHYWAYMSRGMAYLDKDQYDTAIGDFDTAIRLDPNPDLSFPYRERGLAYWKKGQYDTAIRDFDNALGLDPYDILAYINRGQLYRQLGQRDRAIQDLEKALSLNSNMDEVKKELQEIRETAIPANFVRVEGGTFTMGSPANEPERYDKEGPQHQVTVSFFYMGKYEVTQREYQEVMGTNPSYFKGDNLPVEKVSWFDAIEYCNKRSQKEGLIPAYSISGTGDNRTVTWNKNANGYRLPTEAEWEYACRTGMATPFSTGNNITTSQANYNGNYPYNNNAKGMYREKTTTVGSFASNAWGLYDMHGNVWEWCWDWYGSYSSGAQTNPVGASSGDSRVGRGGSWYSYAEFVRSAYRSGSTPSGWDYSLGFRLVRPYL
jgi:formylglycine-generating enzyme required for sulfatase activity/uncharacterized protein with PIN domain